MVEPCRELFTHTLTISPAVEATRTMKSRKHSRLLLRGYVRPMEELETNTRNTQIKSRSLPFPDTSRGKGAYTFRQCGHRANVLSEISVHWKKGARANMELFYKLGQVIQHEQEQWAVGLSPTRNTLEQ